MLLDTNKTNLYSSRKSSVLVFALGLCAANAFRSTPCDPTKQRASSITMNTADPPAFKAPDYLSDLPYPPPPQTPPQTKPMSKPMSKTHHRASSNQTPHQMAQSISKTNRRHSSANEPIPVQGGSLRTWSYRSPLVDEVQVVLSTEGRPLDTDIELWNGPDNTPCRLRVYVENGQLRPFVGVIKTPRGPNTVAIRNIGQMEFPVDATVHASNVEVPSFDCAASATTIQGGALRTYPFDPLVESVQVLLTTDGRPLHARLELLQGPNNNKQVVEVYTEDGFDRPFFCIFETPGSGNVVRVVNTAPVEFPMSASVVPRAVNNDPFYDGDVVISGNCGW